MSVNVISQEKIEEIKNKTDIVDVISNYVSLVPKGKNYFGICPFHDDNNPSMSVSREKKIYKCFSCGATGNAFTFLMNYEKISFIEAVKKLADSCGVAVDVGKIPTKKVYTTLNDIYNLSLKFYINNINTKDGKAAKEYLKSRSIDEKIIKDFEIGLALKNNTNLAKLLQKKFKESDLINSGLIYKNNFGLADLYYDRIMFPLYDLNGQVVAYSGRKYHGNDLEDKNVPKYINTKETSIFKKGELLYNYHRAKEPARSKNQIIVMEGFMDVIRAYSVDITNVVATMGTAVTKNQAGLIKRMAKEVILCFDGDAAGEKATLACAEELIKLGVTPKVIRLEDNLDPDEYILKNGKQQFELKIKNAIDFMDFKLDYLKHDKKLETAAGQAKYINDVIAEINKINDDIYKDLIIKKLVNDTGVDENLIRKQVNLGKTKPKNTVKKEEIPKSDIYDLAQRNLLFYMLESKEVIKMYNNKVTYMPNTSYRLLAREISMFYKQNNYINIADFVSYIEGDEEILSIISEVEKANLSEKYSIEEIEDYINIIKKYNVKNEIKRLKNQMENEIDPIKKAKIGQQIIDLKRGV